MNGPKSEIAKQIIVLERYPTIYSNDLAGLSEHDREEIGRQIDLKMRSDPAQRYPAEHYFTIDKNGDIVLAAKTEPDLHDTRVAFPPDSLLVACLQQIISELKGHLQLAQLPSIQLVGGFIDANSLTTDITQALEIWKNRCEVDSVNHDYSQITVPRNMRGVLHLSFLEQQATIYGDGSDVRMEIKMSRGAKLVIYAERSALVGQPIPTYEGVYTSFDSTGFRIYLSEQAVSNGEKISARPAALKALHAEGELL
jgi:hypothetical protein